MCLNLRDKTQIKQQIPLEFRDLESNPLKLKHTIYQYPCTLLPLFLKIACANGISQDELVEHFLLDG